MGLQFRVVPIDISHGEQFTPEFLTISPNNKMPAIVDTDGPDRKRISLFESGAILLYLAEKSGKLMPTTVRSRYNALEWLMFQMASVGPMLGQVHHFRRYAPEQIQYAIDRYTNEARRIYNLIDRRLGEMPYLAGEYSIVDIATYPWLRHHRAQGQDLNDFPHLKRWHDAIEARAAVQRGLAFLADKVQRQPPKGEEWEIPFGKKQFERH